MYSFVLLLAWRRAAACVQPCLEAQVHARRSGGSGLVCHRRAVQAPTAARPEVIGSILALFLHLVIQLINLLILPDEAPQAFIEWQAQTVLNFEVSKQHFSDETGGEAAPASRQYVLQLDCRELQLADPVEFQQACKPLHEDRRTTAVYAWSISIISTSMCDHMHQLPRGSWGSAAAGSGRPRCAINVSCRRAALSTDSLDLAVACGRHRRNGYRHITATCAELVSVLHAAGPEAALDMDQACMCETMDVIGLFGFGQGFEAVKCAILPASWICLGIIRFRSRASC